MNNVPSQTVLTNELKLHDYKGVKLSITFGDADINDGYSYTRINYRASETKMDFFTDKPTYNFITDKLTLNDEPVWNMFQQGPNTGMNSDMVDGLHGYDLKDRLGSHHYVHMFTTGGSKKFVKIATIIPRRVGNPSDFRADGKLPYEGIFSSLAMKDKIGEFIDNTPINLKDAYNASFQSTNMVTEGIYNGCFRGSITLLKEIPSTIDLHIGLFCDPLNDSTDGWETIQKFFYVSVHDNNVPFIQNTIKTLSEIESYENRVNLMSDNLAQEQVLFDNADRELRNMGITPLHDLGSGNTTPTSTEHVHTKNMDYTGYAEPDDPSKDNYTVIEFPPATEYGDSYDKEFEAFRLYYAGTTTETIDGVSVVVHKYDLYMCTDDKTEFHITPYMSNSCMIYNFEKPLSEGELPTTRYLKPTSIYDSRYAYKNHRHYDYEKVMKDLSSEVSEIWSTFDDYVVLKQGAFNANKIMCTNASGQIYAAKDNFERHTDSTRSGNRVIVSDSSKCVAESDITTNELAQLKNVHSNIQYQIHDVIQRIADLRSEILGNIPSTDGYVLKSGDRMTGHLRIASSSATSTQKLLFENTAAGNKTTYIYGCSSTEEFGIAYDRSGTYTPIMNYDRNKPGVKFFDTCIYLGSSRLTISGSAPSSPSNGDIWIKNT